MKLVRFFFLVVFSFFTLALFAQSDKKLKKEVQKYFDAQQYYEAYQIYKAILANDSSDINIVYHYAVSAYYIYNYPEAEREFKYLAKKYGTRFPELTFYLASCQKQLGKYKEAKKNFEKYAKKNKKKDTKYTRKAIQESASCDYAFFAKANAAKTEIIHCDSNINSPYGELSPFYKDSVLYLSRTTGEGRVTNLSFEYDQKFFNPQQQNLAAFEANTFISSETGKIYFTQTTQSEIGSETRIYEGVKANEKSMEAFSISPFINVEGYHSSQPYVTGYQDSVIYFSSDIPGGSGGYDIWYSLKKKGSWTTPINAGTLVNSEEDEVTPYFSSVDTCLYFSSTWHPGLGGFDIFKSKLHKDGFDKPVNIGMPVNTNFNELYFKVDDKYTKAFFASNRKGSNYIKNEYCCNDIYYFNIDSIHLKAPATAKFDSTALQVTQLKLLVPLSLYFHNDEPDAKTLAISTKKNYEQSFIPYYAMLHTYQSEYTRGLPGDLKASNEERMALFFEDTVAAGMHDLKKFCELLESLMNKNKTVEITMRGFCSPLASTNYNVNLAKRRISSLENYFSQYNNGVFLPYIGNTSSDKGKIIMKEVDIGELQANPHTSDNPNDTKNSIYSISAASERKIQIIAVEVIN